MQEVGCKFNKSRTKGLGVNRAKRRVPLPIADRHPRQVALNHFGGQLQIN